MTTESGLEKAAKRIRDFDDGVSDAFRHPIESVRYWNNTSFMRKIGRIDVYMAYLILAAGIAAIPYELLR
jgi:hypothetical protein